MAEQNQPKEDLTTETLHRGCGCMVIAYVAIGGLGAFLVSLIK
jgi:hypothetical protein